MKKNNFIKGVFILIVGGFVTKILGMIIKIVMARFLGTSGIGLYMFISPTFMLLITLASLGFPLAISKLVAEEKNSSKKIIFSLIPVSLIINLLIIIILLFFSSFLANYLLHDKNLKFPLLMIALVLPFISISSMIRSYFFGKSRMFPHVVSNIAEDIIRLITLIIGIPIFMKYGIYKAISFIIASNIISELTSIFVLLFFMPKKARIKKEDLLPSKKIIKSALDISIPSTGSRIIGNVSHFLEPIIIIFILGYVGYQNKFIVDEYGIINGFVLPILLLPSFFTSAISQALLPLVSNYYVRGLKNQVAKRIKQACFYSLLIGIPATILFFCFPSFFLKLVYNTVEGSAYLKFLAPLFVIFYIQAPIASSLQAMNKAGVALKGTVIGVVSKLILITFLSLLKVGLWGLIIGIAVSSILTTLYDLKKLKQALV
jgi:stage V sporulation protein B